MIPFPDKKYNIIYADPAWTFKTWSNKGEEKSPKYDVMTINDIKNLPVNEIIENDCVLFIWVTYPLLIEGLETIKSWGFTYKTCGFSWIKQNKKADSLFWGLGYWTRANNEICLLATKGEVGSKSVINKKVRALINSPREFHSKKPDVVRNRIVELLGDIPRIELFARTRIKGWDVWGNEVPEENNEAPEENKWWN